jgi:hypothetical protein
MKKAWLPVTLVAVLATLGPISALLAAGVARSWKNGDKVLAVLYLAAIPAGLQILGAAVFWAAEWAAASGVQLYGS